MKQIAIYIVVLFVATTISALSHAMSKAEVYDAETERWLVKLDSIIIYNNQYEAEQRQIVNKMMLQRNRLQNQQEIYKLNSELYNECRTFDSAIAMEAVEMNLAYAQKIGNRNMIVEWTIKKSFQLSVTGMLSEAADVLRGIDGSLLPHNLQVVFYEQMNYLYAHFAQYTGVDPHHDTYMRQASAYRDSLNNIIEPTDANYVWHNALKTITAENADSISSELEKIIDSSNLDTPEAAANAYTLAQICKQMGNNSGYLQNLSKSSIADLRIANKDIASLEELAGVLYNQCVGDADIQTLILDSDDALSRANAYISLCMQKVLAFNNRVRMVSISRIIDNIQHTYIERNAEQRKQLRGILSITLVLLLILAVASIFLVRMYRKKKRTNHQLESINSQLHTTNDALQESNFVKEEYIGHMFSLCSGYISKMDEYRKNINRKLKVNQYDDALSITNKPLAQAEMEKFYKDFDTIFLHIYPNFIEEFNNLLQPEERIVPQKDELLNTQLRIYALVRLGINDSVKIAKLLHCSPQTIYNNRLKIRNKAIVAKDAFADYVKQLGRKKS